MKTSFLKKSLLLLAIVSLGTVLSAAPPPENRPVILKAGREVSIPAIGFKFRSFKDCTQQPLPALTILEATNNLGGKFQVYENGMAAWINEQCESYLTGDAASIYIAVPRLPVPGAHDFTPLFPDRPGIVLKQEFDQWKMKADPKTIDLEKWLAAFAGSELESDTSEKFRAASSNTLVRKYRSRRSPNRILYFYSDPKRTDPGVAVLYEFGKNTDYASKKSQKVLSASAASVLLTMAKQEKKSAAVPAAPGGAGHRKNGEPRSAAYEQSRETVLANIKNLPGWWSIETDYYIIVSNLEKRKDIERIRAAADQLRRLYEKVAPLVKPLDAVSVIRVFQDREDYLRYVGPELQWSVGVWMPMKQEMVISPVDWMKGKDRSRELLRTMRHEMFHQYLFYAVGQQNISEWFNEGMAQVLEDLNLKNAEKASIEPERASLDAGRVIVEGRYPGAEAIVGLTHEQFVTQREQSYPATFSLMYFLTKGVPAMKNPPPEYLAVPGKYYEALIRTRSIPEADRIAWEGVNMDRFNQDFKTFWKSKTLQTRSRNTSIRPFSGKEAAPEKN